MSANEQLLQLLLKEEEELQFDEFTNDTACSVGMRIIRRAEQNEQAVVVDIRKDGEQLFYARMNGKSSRNDEWVTWKNNIVNYYSHSSYYMHVYLKLSNASIEDDGLNPDTFKAVGGAFPLREAGKGITGTITVSGLTGEQDHYMVVDCLREERENSI